MANIIRSSKCGSDWCQNDLTAYNISVVLKTDSADFFGLPVTDIEPSIDATVMSFDYDSDYTNMQPKHTRNLIRFMDLATTAPEESTVDEFANRLLVAMDYDSGDTMVQSRKVIPLLSCGIYTVAQTDVCVMRGVLPILLMIQEDKTILNPKDPEPQVIAEAIAAFQTNNRILRDLGFNTLNRMVIPCVTMVGTFPHFYLVPVTTELSMGVKVGTYPSEETVVTKHIPAIPWRMSKGMKNLRNRKCILKCFEAFKHFVDELDVQLGVMPLVGY